MAREVVWTEPGWEDLEAAAEYIARDSEFYAATLVREARDAAASLAGFADRGQIVPEFADESIREFLLKPLSSCIQSDRRTRFCRRIHPWLAATLAHLSRRAG